MTTQFQSDHHPAEAPEPMPSEGWDKIQGTFAKLYQIKSADRREYELHQAAQACGIPTEVYRQLFKNFQQAQLFASGRRALSIFGKSPLQALKAGLDILTRLGWVSMLAIAVTLSLQLFEVWEREEYLSWAILSLNQGKAANGGRLLALQNLRLMGSNLAGLNLENAVVPGLDLSGADLLQANFKNASLMRANLSHAKLVYADLSLTDLEHATFRQANLELANLEGSQLNHVNFKAANLYRANLKGANLSGADLRNVQNLDQANLRGAIYDAKTQFPPGFDPSTRNAILIQPQANLQGVNLSGATLMQVDLSQTNLSNANLSGAFLLDANLTNANLKGANLTKAQGLVPSQIKAAQNWQQAEYDQDFRADLGLPANLTAKPDL